MARHEVPQAWTSRSVRLHGAAAGLRPHGGIIPALSSRARQALIAAGAFAGGAALAVPLVAPELLRRRVLEAIHERTGLAAELGSVDLGLQVVSLHALRVHGSTRHGVLIDASFETIELDYDAGTALTGGIEGVRSVRAHGGHVAISLGSEPAIEDGAPAASGAASEPAAPAADPTELPTIELSGVSLHLDDAEGRLLAAGEISGSISAEGAEASASDVTVEAGPLWTLARARVAFARGGDDPSLRLGRLEAANATLSVASDESGRIERLSRAFRRLSGLRRGASEGPPEAAVAADSAHWLDRLTEDFSAELADLAITVERAPADPDAGELASIHSFEATIDRVGEQLRTRGSATPGATGRLRWDLELEPRALLAAGTLELERISLAVLAPFLPRIPLHEPELAEVSGSLSLERADLAGVRGSGMLDVLRLGLFHPRISPTPVHDIAFSVRGNASWAPIERQLTIEEVFVRAPSSTGGAAEVRLAGSIVWQPERYAFDLRATLPSTRCNDAVHAIPHDLLGELAPISLGGSLGGFVDVHVDSEDLDRTTLAIRVADGCRFESVPPFADPARFTVPFHHRAVESDGDVFEMDTGPGTSAWTPISQVSPFFLHAVVSHEDASFFVHPGFAPWAIRDALVQNLRAGRYVRGASTITMQLVKNAFLHREKTLARKVQEVLLTWWVETAMTKQSILELYVNVIELGDGVYGVRDAAHTWFGREPGELSAAESVYLAMILPNPPAFAAEHRREGRPPEAFRRRMASFMRHLGETNRYDAAAVEAGLREIESLRFFHPGDPTPALRVLAGSTSALPIGIGTDPSFLDELGLSSSFPGSDGADETDEPGLEPGEASWDRWEEVVP